MRTLLISALAGAALVAAAPATGGGWATVGVSPQPPDTAGSVWNVELRVLQHGRTPLDGLRPTIMLTNRDTGATETIPAAPTGEPGMYAARVEFASAGTWTYAIDDDFSRVHTFRPIEIGGGPAGDSGFPTVPVTVGVVLALAAALVVVARRRQLRPAPAPAPR